MDNLLFYDVEVFKTQSCVVFKTEDGKTDRIFTNNLNGLGEYIDKGIIQGCGYDGLREYISDKILIGYNNYHYDDYILYAMSQRLKKDLEPDRQTIIKAYNDTIIKNGDKMALRKIENTTFDCFQQIDVSKPGLKKIEGNLGKSIIESEVDFTIERELTSAENLETVKYCEYDVLMTIEIWKMRKDYFHSKLEVLKMLDEKTREKAFKWNTTSIIGTLLKWEKGSQPTDSQLSQRNKYDYVPAKVTEMWEQLDDLETQLNGFDFKKKKVTVEEFGNKIEFGWGGLHGAPKGFVYKEDVKLLDVGSMYPNILINLDGLGNMTKYYKEILDHRLELKHQGKKKEQAPLKLILNSTYGLLNNKYSQLNRPYLAYNICLYGQISLYVLSQRLSNIGCEVFNINTDGVAFTGGEDEHIKQIWHSWEKEFNLTLELDEFDKWWQKDVNNYVALTKNGKIKVKGGDVNKYFGDTHFKNMDTIIVHKALVDKLVYNIPFETTIMNNLDKPELFQYILQAGRTYKGTFDRDGNKYNKINRVFAAKDGDFQLFKVKENADGSKSYAKFPNAPDRMFLWNDDVDKLENFKDVVDIQWYYDLTNKIYQRWKK